MDLAFALVIAIIWAVTNIALKTLLGHFKPDTILCLTSFSVAIFAAIYISLRSTTRTDVVKNLSWSSGCAIIAVAFIGLFLPSLLYYTLLSQHPVHLVMAIAYTSPVILLLILALSGTETLNLKSIVGVGLVVCGVIICVLSSKK